MDYTQQSKCRIVKLKLWFILKLKSKLNKVQRYLFARSVAVIYRCTLFKYGTNISHVSVETARKLFTNEIDMVDLKMKWSHISSEYRFISIKSGNNICELCKMCKHVCVRNMFCLVFWSRANYNQVYQYLEIFFFKFIGWTMRQ